MKILPLLFLLGMSFFATAEEFFKDIGASEAKELIILEKPPTVLDVRSNKEYTKGHIKGAINLDLYSKDFKAQLASLDKKQTYLLHCKSGGRSAKAETVMRELGFTSIYHMTCGYDGWLEELKK